MKIIGLLLTSILLAGCSNRAKTPDVAEEYSRNYYTPRFAKGFALRSLEEDTTALMLEIYRPDTTKITIPRGGFQRLMCMSSTHVGLLGEIGGEDKIVAVSGRDYLTNQSVKAAAIEAGYDGAMNYEAITVSKPEIALIYGIGGENPIAGKLEELGIKPIYISDFEEQTPLGRAEWMIALGALTGIDGRERFEEIAKEYKPVSGTTAVMLNAPYSGTWFIPGRDNYFSHLIADAGGKICVDQQQGTESKGIDMEQALPALAEARIWLNPGKGMKVAKAKFSGKRWNQTPDFYESGAARPDLVLKELQKIMTDERTESLHYFEFEKNE